MTSRQVFRGVHGWLALLFAIVALAACAVSPDIVDHSFSFNMHYDGQEDIEVLDYQYGNSKLPVRADPEKVRVGKVFGGTSVSGPMFRGEFLYVKWRIKSTGEICEDKVDLRSRLPTNIEGHKVTFLIRGTQLYVYLVSPHGVLRPKDKPPNGPSSYAYRDTITIYP